jgi:ubiquinol-cytochrome c reductase cytochrome c subunit
MTDLPASANDRATRVTTGEPAGRRSRLRRKLTRGGFLLLALAVTGAAYGLFVPTPPVVVAEQDPAIVRQGGELFHNSCLSCHGANLEGVKGRGPSLVGVGEAAVYFQVSTGRMPLSRQEAQSHRKPPVFTPEQIDALAAYVHSYGGGKEMPEDRGADLRGDVARGGDLFRLNCASCHNFTGRGGALSSGKYAPELDPANEEQIYTAMLTGPSNMPVFSERTLSPEQKRDIIAYVKSVQGERDSYGGQSLGKIGPVTEGAAAFAVGVVALLALCVWIGARS